MKKAAVLGIVLAAAGAGLTAEAQNNPSTRLSLKGLDGVGLKVEAAAGEDPIPGLTTQALRAAVEARLRKASIRLLSAEQQQQLPQRPGLEVRVAASRLNTGEYLYSIHVEVAQWVASLGNSALPVSAAVPLPARTWAAPHTFGIASAGEIGPGVQAAVGSMVEEFIDAYYQANPSLPAFEARRGGKLR